MTRDEVIKYMRQNPGAKITHRLFDTHEYIYCGKYGWVFDEKGYLFEDWFSTGPAARDGMRDRHGGRWEIDWRVIDTPRVEVE